MKRDKTKEMYPLVLDSTPAGGSNISSITLALQLLNKEKENIKEAEKKESDAEAAKSRCRTCFKEIAPTRLCFGHGGGGGGEGGSPSTTSEEKPGHREDKPQTKSGKGVEITEETLGEKALDSESSFDPEIIERLISMGLLMVDNDRESMTLSITLLCEANELTEEQSEELKKFMEVIIKELHEFQEENHLSDDCIKIIEDQEGSIRALRITMPTLALYDAFMQRLADNLVPIPRPKAPIKDEIEKNETHGLNPLAMESNLSKDECLTHEERELFNPSPFNIKPW
jgi:hypothetical protein